MKTNVLLFTITATLMLSCKSIKNKNFNTSITEKYWKLITLSGQEIKMTDNQKREIFITLKTKENRFTGFGGCNGINGEYILGETNQIEFTKMISTRMFCPNTHESDFLKALKSADNYTIKNDVLYLYNENKTPLAVFNAVYLQ